MRAREFVIEVNAPGELTVPEELVQRFTTAGWTIEGEGHDQIVLSKPNSNYVLKIVGQGSSSRIDQIRRYIDFYRRNQRNPHWPRVGGDRTLKWGDQTYYAYTQEKLRHLPGDEAVLDYLENAMREIGHGREPDFAKIPPGLSARDIDGLINAVEHLFSADIGGQYQFDLSNVYNIMQRDNGQLVIVDPFAGWDDDDDELSETVHPDITGDDYFNDPTKNVRMGDFVFNARTFTGGLGDPNARGLQIRAYDPKNLKSSIGSADFVVKSDARGRQWLESDDTEVDDEYRGQGVAAMMYAFARSLGNDIKDSPHKSRAGGDMWRKWGADAKHLVGEQGVAEKVNHDIAKKDWRDEKIISVPDVGELRLVGRNISDVHPPQFVVDVFAPDGQKIGYFRFLIMDYEQPKKNIFGQIKKPKKDSYVIGGNISVWREYQRKGIARQVYQWIKSLGNDIQPSTTQTAAGKAMWKSFDRQGMAENFADGKVKGKSRPGRVKRAGASCDGSVTDLRAKARKYGGEKGKMYHWCANMKGGRKK